MNILQEHLKWLNTLPLYLEYKHLKTSDNRYLVVSHSHILNSWKYRNYPKTSNEYKLFEKETLLSRYKKFDNINIFNVFGHTLIQNPKIDNYRANILLL